MIVDILQRANYIMQRSEFEKLERAYEQSYLEAVKYRNIHPRAIWTREHKMQYNELLIRIDIAKTNLAQFVALRNVESYILY